MSNEYVVSESSLISVADSIRTKCDTSDPLVFPEGFVTAIEGISELNFEMVGGTTQPSNPKENTIWVNTETEITGWIFSVEAPETPTLGMIWIKVGVVSDTPFNALKTNSFLAYPLYASQYINDAFEITPAKIYYNGAWFSFDAYPTFLFYYSKQTYAWQTRAWGLQSGNPTGVTPSVVTNADGSVSITVSASGAAGCYELVEDFDLTGVTALKLTCSISTTSSSVSDLRLIVVPRNAAYWYPSKLAEVVMNKVGDHEVTLPINISGKYDIVIAMYHNVSGSNTLTMKSLEFVR